MSLLQLICFFLQRISPDQVYVETEIVSEIVSEFVSEPGYFFFDEDTGDIHSL